MLKKRRAGATVAQEIFKGSPVLIEKKISIAGAEVRYLEGGEGAPLLLLPSAAGRAAEYQPLIPLLENDFHLFSLDYPGFGQSDPIEQIEGTGDLADFVLHWMDGVGLPRCHVAGFSLGGWIALSLALSHPERIAKLVLIATSAERRPDIPIINPSGMSHREILEKFYYRPEVRERLARQKLSSSEKEELLRSSRALARLVARRKLIPRFGRRLHEIRLPTLIIAADRDEAIPLPYQEDLRAGIAGSEQVVFRETGHAIIAERPQELAEAIRAFL